MSVRLSTIAADLTTKLTDMSAPDLRRMTAELVEAAVTRTGLGDQSLEAAVAAMRDGRYGDSANRERLKALETELDERAWDLQDQADRGEVDQEEYLAAFRRARAASAAWFALDDDALQAALEAAYEVRAATDDDEVRRIVGSVTG
jgi:hypothetical protein